MSDLTLKLSALKLGKSLENLSAEVENELNLAVGNLANAAYASMISQIQHTSMDPKNRQDLLKGLQFSDLGNNSYMIHLDGDWANKLEDGFAGYSIKEKLLASKKTVQVGARAGEPWVRTSKTGNKYAAVPFDHKPFAAGAGDLDSEIKNMKAFNRQGKEQSITKIFKDGFGQAIHGKVATVKSSNHSFLQGLTKYQYVYDSGKVSSIYMTFRMVSEKSGGWQHPGWKGHHFFEMAEREIEEQLNDIVKSLI